jgi:type IV pilus assembly protein PilA
MRAQHEQPNLERGCSRAQGFTLVELMVVIAIVSILAVIALPAYLDYVIRSQVVEGVTFAAEAKTSVSEYYYSNGYVFPEGNDQAGLPPAGNYGAFNHVSRLEITTLPRPGTIQITFKIEALGSDNLLQLVPATVDNLVSWTCTPAADNGIAVTRVPPNCRG